jgi:leucyl-tRNA synthetase
MSEAETPAFRYTAALANQIEKRWQDYWSAHGTFYAPNPVGPLADPAHPRSGAPKKFVLDMFPYPSGAGLHVGHPLGFIGTDVFARFNRMAGHNVLHTMGFDAFGLPAEQYAVQTGTHPRVTTEQNIERYRAQLRMLGLGHDERRGVATTDVDFYRWTQWIFLKIFNSWYDEEADRARPIAELSSAFASGERATSTGRPWAQMSEEEQRAELNQHRLAYVSNAPVNWCPGLGTVLANEEVTADGRSERGNFPVFKANLKQWMMRITAYGDRLIDDLDTLDWPEPIKLMQRNWIGRSLGAHVDFVSDAGPIKVFTTRPDTLFGATYMVLAPEHELVSALTPAEWPDGTNDKWTGGHKTPADAVAAYRAFAASKTDVERQADAKEKTGVFIGAYATNPVNGELIPVFIADYVLAGYGTGAIMAVPGQDERDWAFAEVFELPIIRTVEPPEGWAGKAYTGEGPAVNSGMLDGLGVAEAKKKITDWLAEQGTGVGATTYRLRDWLFSRQRYWGEPFPVVYEVREDGTVDDEPIALPDEMLPLELPEVADFSPKLFDPNDANTSPETPLSRAREWVEVELDLGDGPKKYRRETNTMPNWAGSCWYELRYLDPTNTEALVDPAIEHYWMGPSAERPLGGVELYVGGVEHAVLHLLYARFWHKVLYDLGYVSSSEPFHRLVNQGYVQAYAFTDARGMYVPAERVEEQVQGDKTIYLYEGQPVTREYGKMGKSLKNVTTPDEMYQAYGADTLRLFEMFTGPLEQDRPWDTKAVVGSYRLLQRIWRVILDEQTGEAHVSDEPAPDELNRLLHKTIHAVREGFESLRFNTSIARITELNNALTQAYPNGGTPRAIAEPLVLLLAPLAPHAAEELWARLGHESSLAWEPFPVADESLLLDRTIEIPVQVNGKVRSVINVAADTDADAIAAAARADEKVKAALGDREPRRVVTVPGRLVNFVL